MSIRKRPSKKALSGYTYQVYFPYVDSMGIHREYFKGGFTTKKDAQTHEAIKRKEFMDYGDVLANREITFNEVFEEYWYVPLETRDDALIEELYNIKNIVIYLSLIHI